MRERERERVVFIDNKCQAIILKFADHIVLTNYFADCTIVTDCSIVSAYMALLI